MLVPILKRSLSPFIAGFNPSFLSSSLHLDIKNILTPVLLLCFSFLLKRLILNRLHPVILPHVSSLLIPSVTL